MKRHCLSELVNAAVSIRSPVETRGDNFGLPPASLSRFFKPFQSAPPVETRGDVSCTAFVSIRPYSGFNPLPPSKRGETDMQLAACRSRTLRSEFQSAPPVETRGDGPVRMCTDRSVRTVFQSAPPVETRGDFRLEVRADALDKGCRVSIRSPRRNEGRLIRQRIDPHSTIVVAMSCFNPLPPSKRGETTRATTLTPSIPYDCFNPLPRRNEGRRGVTA